MPSPAGLTLLVPLLGASLLLASGCNGAKSPLDDPTPLPARILSDREVPLQPLQLPEVKQPTPASPEDELTPPPGGDPKARAVVLGKAPAEEAVIRRPDGRLQVGRIIVDPAQGEMLLSGEINQTDGIVEYMAVGPKGKRHESVLMFDVHPLHLQVACILLGLKPASLPNQEDPELQVVREGSQEADPAPPVPAAESLVLLEVTWLEKGKPITHRAEDLAYNQERKRPMDRGPWVYNGGIVYRGVLTAEFEQSYIATWPDRSALFNTPQITHNPYRGDMQGFAANYAVLPPKGTPVRITIRRLGLPATPGNPPAP